MDFTLEYRYYYEKLIVLKSDHCSVLSIIITICDLVIRYRDNDGRLSSHLNLDS